jgi:DNA-binding response OmpR family regulator
MAMVVDDEALIRWCLAQGLSDRGYEVLQAGSAAEARTALASSAGRPLVIVLDLRLPDVTDLSLLRELRVKRPDAPVIMMTAHGSEEDGKQALALGACQFIGKPFDLSEVCLRVDTAWMQQPPRVSGPAEAHI